MQKLLIISLCFISLNLSVLGQNTGDTEHKKVQITFLYPVGSNGLNSQNFSNKFSLNTIGGLNGGVDGFELGGVFNLNKGNVRGFQLGGVANLNEGSLNGFQLSGVLNYSKSKSEGFQLSVINIVEDDLSGFQLGVINSAKKLKGLQLGVINIVDTLDQGIPIGVLSFVKKGGFHSFEVTSGETFFANISYKIGVERFYSIFKLGTSYYKGKNVLSYGFGLGSKIHIRQNSLNIDLTANEIGYDRDFGSKVNLLNKLDLTYNVPLMNKINFLIGPSFNYYITKEKLDDSYGTISVPYTIYKKQNKNSKSFGWIGFNAGISVEL